MQTIQPIGFLEEKNFLEPPLKLGILADKKLIIEVDGGQHADAIEYDQKRTMFLESKGYAVIRFWNNEILTNIEGVYQVLQKHLN